MAYTAGPGLMGAPSRCYARSLSCANIPALAVHHMEAHLLAPAERKPPLPFVALLYWWPYPAGTCGATCHTNYSANLLMRVKLDKPQIAGLRQS